jgi:hypothetical protein
MLINDLLISMYLIQGCQVKLTLMKKIVYTNTIF